ncbi:hypothetical protein AVEN_121164-1 [Araneus ventricosus]|uniref:Uncharacterized protein n=1 Tax=Araneus ventricosus TaxID=182803 RepID=A0A4Y2E396_ARAVE|nr:hypothetical protein AVEN_121164-1 [Araneus ventricosus]
MKQCVANRIIGLDGETAADATRSILKPTSPLKSLDAQKIDEFATRECGSILVYRLRLHLFTRAFGVKFMKVNRMDQQVKRNFHLKKTEAYKLILERKDQRQEQGKIGLKCCLNCK